MITVAKKITHWDEVNDIHIPKSMMVELNLQTDDIIELRVVDANIVAKKMRPKKSLRQRLEEFYGMPWEEILVHIEENPYIPEEDPWHPAEGEIGEW